MTISDLGKTGSNSAVKLDISGLGDPAETNIWWPMDPMKGGPRADGRQINLTSNIENTNLGPIGPMGPSRPAGEPAAGSRRRADGKLL